MSLKSNSPYRLFDPSRDNEDSSAWTVYGALEAPRAQLLRLFGGGAEGRVEPFNLFWVLVPREHASGVRPPVFEIAFTGDDTAASGVRTDYWSISASWRTPEAMIFGDWLLENLSDARIHWGSHIVGHASGRSKPSSKPSSKPAPGLLAYKKLARDPDAGNPLQAYGEVHRDRLGTYWTVETEVDLSLLERHLAGKPVAIPARLASVKQALKKGVRLPPIELGVFRDGNAWIVDGNHRFVAAKRGGAHTIAARFTFVGN